MDASSWLWSAVGPDVAPEALLSLGPGSLVESDLGQASQGTDLEGSESAVEGGHLGVLSRPQLSVSTSEPTFFSGLGKSSKLSLLKWETPLNTTFFSRTPGLFRVSERKAEDGVAGEKSGDATSRFLSLWLTLWLLWSSLSFAGGAHARAAFRERAWYSASGLLQMELLSLSLKLLIIMLILCCCEREFAPASPAVPAAPAQCTSCASWHLLSGFLSLDSSSSMYWSLRSRAFFKCSVLRSYCWILASRAATVYRPNLKKEKIVSSSCSN